MTPQPNTGQEGRKAKRVKLWYIKERHNPQLGTYYVGMGQLSKTAAKRYEKPLYGDNVMHDYPTEEAYNTRLQYLRTSGERVQ